MIALIQPGRLEGNITITGSKSLMQRACVLALLKEGRTLIQNPSSSADDLAVLDIIRKLGARVEDTGEEKILISGNPGFHYSGTLNCGESGLAFRMLLPVLAKSPGAITITGEGSLLHRKMDFFDKVLPGLGVQVKSAGGFLPISIQGPMQPKDITVDGSMSSQFITGLLFAYAVAAAEGTLLRVRDIVSRPYIDMSLAMLQEFSFSIGQPSPGEFVIGKKSIPKETQVVRISGDWSGGAFFLVAGAINGNLLVQGLDVDSPQGDKEVMEVLKMAGANISLSEQGIFVDDQHPLQSFYYDGTDTPDLFPPLVTLALFCRGISEIKGAHRLLNKESDRQSALVEVFSNMGAKVWTEGDGIFVEGGHTLQPSVVNGHNDHRIVMAAAMAMLASKTQGSIHGAEAVAKSYPAFFQHLIQLGAQVSLT